MTEAQATDLVSSLYKSWYTSLVQYISRRTGGIEAAEDIVQEGFMLLYKELRSGKNVENPKGWTLTVVRRRASKEAQHTLREPALQHSDYMLNTLPDDRPDPLQTEEEADDISRLFSVLTNREEEVIVLRMAAMKYREIAEQLGISQSSVNTLLARALGKLQHAANAESTGAYGSEDANKSTPKTLQ